MTSLFRKILILSLEVLAIIVSPLYVFVSAIRNRLYDEGFFSTESLPVPVVSVGNITFGGTGKTPFVIYLCRLLKEEGYRPAVLTRGYASKGGDAPRFVPTEGGYRKGCGDEPAMIASILKEIPVIVSPDRIAAAKLALDELVIDLFLLDDGFQHRRLERDMDILLIDSQRPFGTLGLLPGLTLRESPAGVNRADLVVLTQCRPELEEYRAEETVRNFNEEAPILHALSFGSCFRTIDEDVLVSADDIRGNRVIGLSGIANPWRFFNDLRRFGALLCGEFVFEDHHDFTQEEIDRIVSRTLDEEAEAVVTTQKDAVRLEELDFRGIPFIYRELQMRIVEEERLLDLVKEMMEKGKQKGIRLL
jgi:tetraacyldisaccharide 4'-kinase